MFEASAPGRLCLLGEHCDWAGGASVVVPMDREIRVSLEPSDVLSASSVLDGVTHEWTAGQEPGALFLVPAVVQVVEQALRRPGALTGSVRIDSDLPAGRGFSSSAALAVALVRALLRSTGREPTPAEVAELAYRAEHDVAGVACGRLDPLACAHGLPLYIRFEGDEPPRVEPLAARLDLAVGAFAAARDTRGILDTLNMHFRGEVPLRDWDATRRVGAVRGALEGFAAQAWHGRVALLESDLRALGGAMDACQEIYEEDLMPAFPPLRAPGLVRATRALKASGALGAKFSGAGGDGSVIGLYPPGGSVRDGVVALDAQGVRAFAVEVWCVV